MGRKIKAKWLSWKDFNTEEFVPFHAIEFEDSKGKKWYMDLAERFNAFNFNKFKGWRCNDPVELSKRIP